MGAMGAMGAAHDARAWRLRALAPSDDLAALTDLLHQSYAPLGARGLNYTAVDQTVEVTRQRVSAGLCIVAEAGCDLIGTATLSQPRAGSVPEYARMPCVNQVAVAPDWQGRGLGNALMQHVEQQALDEGWREVGVDTAEPATHLVHWYERRGYRVTNRTRWNGKHYDSLILVKALT